MGRPNLAIVDDEHPATKSTETVTCIAGHTYERVATTGVPPRACKDHQRFMEEALSKRLSPPARVLKEWRTAATLLEDDEYAKRWHRLWEKVVRELGAKGGSFRFVDPEPVESYVRHVRLAELHRLYAEEQPYVTSAQTGMVRQHPGWDAARIEERLARQEAVGLGLYGSEKPQGGNDDGRNGSEPDGGGGEDGDRVIDDQLGPDGQPL